VPNEAPSSEHSNVEPASLAEKLKLASRVSTAPDGPESIVVVGPTVSGRSAIATALSSALTVAGVFADSVPSPATSYWETVAVGELAT